MSSTVSFSEHHLPALEAGNYRMTVKQGVRVGGESQNSYQAVQSFTISGARYAIPPQQVVSSFPPPDSLGDHASVLPHVLLRRSTLPWERSGRETIERTTPWLALAVFTSDDPPPAAQVMTLKDLRASADTAGVSYPQLSREPDQADEEKVTIIDLTRELAQRCLPPTAATLALLAHVRIPDGVMEEALAAVVAARLPKPSQAAGGTATVVHLVSLEARYGSNGKLVLPSEGEVMRLVSLHHWSFRCLEPKQNFVGLLESLDADGAPRLPPSAVASTKNAEVNDYAKAMLKAGYTLLEHPSSAAQMSWYRGPMVRVSGPFSPDVELKATSSTQLIERDAAGLADVSKAASWEIGRFACLANRSVSRALMRWKQDHMRARRAGSAEAFPFAVEPAAAAFPDEVMAFMRGLVRLEGLPFGMLIADERMLPAESMRFFELDAAWMAHLLAGAFSVGRVSAKLAREDHLTATETKVLETVWVDDDDQPLECLSGVLIRSAVVAGWPRLKVDGWSERVTGSDVPSDPPLPLLRCARLSTNVLLALFPRSVQTVDVQQHPEALHFGFDETGDAISKRLRASSGTRAKDAVAVPLRDPAHRVVDIEGFASANGIRDGGQLALGLIEGVDLVRFQSSDN